MDYRRTPSPDASDHPSMSVLKTMERITTLCDYAHNAGNNLDGLPVLGTLDGHLDWFEDEDKTVTIRPNPDWNKKYTLSVLAVKLIAGNLRRNAEERWNNRLQCLACENLKLREELKFLRGQYTNLDKKHSQMLLQTWRITILRKVTEIVTLKMFIWVRMTQFELYGLPFEIMGSDIRWMGVGTLLRTNWDVRQKSLVDDWDQEDRTVRLKAVINVNSRRRDWRYDVILISDWWLCEGR
ncbi:hypothetical protein K435DRAFT_791150 [Dendrothele bispora CBS 962.96]|uniref:Uncharacterized protein n=1 Tax=Dendrothele bispora (strain CBS 962.96) TaxID=1314807 RepID=A0A4S8MMY0_DENBC|nr:hypothetical protein K435DRAFT_791150 [Dendrothele bispora CBS 962.96]